MADDRRLRSAKPGGGCEVIARPDATLVAVGCLLAAMAIAVLALVLSACASSASTPVRTAHVLNLYPYAGKLRYLEPTSPAGTRLLFDTGGGLTLLSPTSAASVRCVPYTRLTALRMSGERFDVDGCGPVRLAFDTLLVEPDVGVFDLMTLLPDGLPPLDGLASLQTFTGHVVTIDLANNRMEVADSPDPRALVDMSALPIRLSRPAAGAGLDVVVRIQGTHGPLWFELDSANLGPVIVADRALDQFNLSPQQVEALKRGETVDIGLPIDGLGRVVAAATAGDIIYDGVLNAAFLERAVIVLDLVRSLAWGRLNE